jgi:hypothetical protein
VKLRKNASDTCALPSKAYGGEALKKSGVFRGINGSKRVARICKMMKEVIVQDLTELKKMLKKFGNLCIQVDI